MIAFVSKVRYSVNFCQQVSLCESLHKQLLVTTVLSNLNLAFQCMCPNSQWVTSSAPFQCSKAFKLWLQKHWLTALVLVQRVVGLFICWSIVCSDDDSSLRRLLGESGKTVFKPRGVTFVFSVMIAHSPVLDTPRVSCELGVIRRNMRLQRASQDRDSSLRYIKSAAVHEDELAAQGGIIHQLVSRFEAFLARRAVELVVAGYQSHPLKLFALGDQEGTVLVVVCEPTDIADEKKARCSWLDLILVLDAFGMQVGHVLDGNMGT